MISTAPDILVYSEDAITVGHGTGTIFQRNFSAYPPGKLFNVCYRDSQSALIERRLPLLGALTRSKLAIKLENRGARFLHQFTKPFSGKVFLDALNVEACRDLLQATLPPADILYAICHNSRDFLITRLIHEAIPPGTPLVVHIHDFFPNSHFGFWGNLKRLAPQVTAFWAVSQPIADALQSKLGRQVDVDPQFYTRVPPQHKRNYQLNGGLFRPVLLGNVWQNELLHDLKKIWNEAKAQIPGMQPVAWHCHPQGIERLRAAGFEPEPEIVPAPFLSGVALFDQLCEYDLSIVPFSRHVHAGTDYERYSMPSRMTEVACAGLPTLVLAGEETPLSQYVQKRNIGLSCPSIHSKEAAELTCRFALDSILREKLGQAARSLAELEFSLEERQSVLYATIRKLTGQRVNRVFV